MESAPIRKIIKDIFGKIGIELPIGPTPFGFRRKFWEV